MSGDMWFGTLQKMQWVPGPQSGVQRRNVSSIQSGTLDRGGGYASRSPGFHTEYGFDFAVREAQGVAGLDVFAEYAAGMWNDYTNLVDGFNPKDLIYFVDPMDFESNLFPPHWASPALGLQGWPMIGEYTSNAATPANSNSLPARSVTYGVTTAANTHSTVNGRTIVIPIPPGYTLRWSARGSATGTAVIRAVAHNKSGGSDLVQSVAPVAVTSNTLIGNGINGDVYDYVTFGIARTSSAASTITLAGMVAQLHRNALTPTTTGPHVAGRGHTGCQFLDAAIPEEYYMAVEGRHLKGLSFGLIETGAWL